MTQEEKAKAYDELKVKAQELEEDGCFDKLTLFDLFPELAESEDERIRKSLSAYFAKFKAYDMWNADFSFGDIVAWFEKQGKKGANGNDREIPFSEQKPADKVDQHSLPVSDNSSLPTFDESIYHPCTDEVCGQKPTEWSEEDELHIRELERLVKQVWAIAEHENDKESIHKMSDLSFFLKTLKPQLKQEWSEEDEYKYNTILHHLDLRKEKYKKECNQEEQDRYQGLYDWLKSLRPQNRYAYNPYKAVVESIAEMCKKYEDANLDSLKDFYSNVKVKCKDAKEYDSLFPSQSKPSDEQKQLKDYSTLEITDVVRQALRECESFRNIRPDLYAARVGATVENLTKKQRED